jgi:hypothetical protein
MEMSEQDLKDLRTANPQASDEQFRMWLSECRMRGAIPGKDIFLQIRSSKEWDEEKKTKVWKKKALYITSVGFLRTIAERSKMYAGQLPPVWVYLDDNGLPTIESKFALQGKHPYAVQVAILRKGWDHALTVAARWDAYAQKYKDGDAEKLTPTWALRGPEQLEKCAETLALRKAFPEECSGVYVPEELPPNDEQPRSRKTRLPSTTKDLDAVAEEEEIRMFTGEKPTKEEMQEYSKTLKGYAEIVGSDNLRTFVINKFKVKKLQMAGKEQWVSLLAELANCNDVKTLVGGKQ